MWGLQGCTRIALDEVDEEILGEAMTLAWQSAAVRRATGVKRAGSRRARKS